jgi:hypothetical protein
MAAAEVRRAIDKNGRQPVKDVYAPATQQYRDRVLWLRCALGYWKEWSGELTTSRMGFRREYRQ